jgi:hypothetical protein
MTTEGIIFFDTLGFGWVVDLEMIQRLYKDYWNGETPSERVLISDLTDPLNFNPS